MHLRHEWDIKTHSYRAAPDFFVVTDDFGTKFDALVDREPGQRLDQTHYSKRLAALIQEHADPDYFRSVLGKPRWHRVSEAMAFSSPMGLSIELQLLIDFHIHPNWDEEAGDAYFDRSRGACIEILYLNATLVEDGTHPVTLDSAALQEFCWQYVELERARGVAQARITAEALA